MATDDNRETPPVEPAAPTDGGGNRPWYEGRIDALTRQRREAEEAVQARDARIKELEARVSPAVPATPVATPGPVPGAVPLQEVERLATERAQVLADNQVFNTRANEIYSRGIEAHGQDFQRALDQLKLTGGLGRHHVEAMIEAGAPERIIMELAKDPNEAARVLGLPAVQGIAAIAKLGVKLAGATPVKVVSNAPAPLGEELRGGSANGEIDLADGDSDIAAWMAKRNEEVAKRPRR